MTVKDLIEQLSKLDQEKDIEVYDIPEGWHAEPQIVDQDKRVLLAVR